MCRLFQSFVEARRESPNKQILAHIYIMVTGASVEWLTLLGLPMSKFVSVEAGVAIGIRAAKGSGGRESGLARRGRAEQLTRASYESSSGPL